MRGVIVTVTVTSVTQSVVSAWIVNTTLLETLARFVLTRLACALTCAFTCVLACAFTCVLALNSLLSPTFFLSKSYPINPTVCPDSSEFPPKGSKHS